MTRFVLPITSITYNFINCLAVGRGVSTCQMPRSTSLARTTSSLAAFVCCT